MISNVPLETVFNFLIKVSTYMEGLDCPNIF